jgi:uncharacterized spore protein YtfJ
MAEVIKGEEVKGLL